MKFGAVLKNKMTPEWRTQYFQYKFVKEVLSGFKQEVARLDPVARGSFVREFTDGIFDIMNRELEKINHFFIEKVKNDKEQFLELQNTLGKFLGRQRGNSQSDTYGTFLDLSQASRYSASTTLQEFEFAFSEIYLGLVLLQNYQELNKTAFRKILKKFDKTVGTNKGLRWYEQHVIGAEFATNTEVEALLRSVENEVIQKIANGDRKRAMNRLRVPPLGEPQHSPWTVLRTGLWCGSLGVILLILAFLVPWSICDEDEAGCWQDSCTPSNLTDALANDEPKFWDITIRLYRGMFLFSLMVLLLGINFYGWASSGVNHVLIFELDPRDHLSSLHLLEVGIALIMLCSVSLTLWLLQFYLAYIFLVDPNVIRYTALSFIIFVLLFVFNPAKICMYSSRMFLLKVVFRIVTAPFHDVRFADFWLADQFTSLVPVFQDFAFIICSCALHFHPDEVETICEKKLTILTSVLGCMPAWFRFWQCIRRWFDSRMKHPHLTNAGKYSCTFFVILFKTLHEYWDLGDIGPGRPSPPVLTTAYPSNATSSVIPTTSTSTASPYLWAQNPFLWLWIVAAIVNTCYTFSWDIKMDWGLLQDNVPDKNRFLRKYLIYGHKWYYYSAMVVDFLLRCAWTITVLDLQITDQAYINSIFISSLTFVEMFRRFLWNFFRLENEHINNCDEFRAIRHFRVRYADHSATIERMQPEEPEPSNRNVTDRFMRWFRRMGAKFTSEASEDFVSIFESQNSMTCLVMRSSDTDASQEAEEQPAALSSRHPSNVMAVEASVHESFAYASRRNSYRPRLNTGETPYSVRRPTYS